MALNHGHDSRKIDPEYIQRHKHVHSQPDFGRAFAVGIGLNTTFVLIEVAFGIIGNSAALLADAGHNVSDIIGLSIAWGASILTHRPPTTRFTYGLSSSSILAALFNAMFLLVAVGAIGWEAIHRFLEPLSLRKIRSG